MLYNTDAPGDTRPAALRAQTSLGILEAAAAQAARMGSPVQAQALMDQQEEIVSRDGSE